MDLWAIGQALVDTLATAGIDNATNYAPDSINPPCAIVAPPPVDYDLTFGRNFSGVPLPIVVFTSRAIDVVGQQQLFTFSGTGDGSVKAALEAYMTDDSDPPGADLGVTSLQVKTFRPLGAEEVAAYQMFGGEFMCQIYVEDS